MTQEIDKQTEQEANYFSKQDNRYARSIHWNGIPFFQKQVDTCYPIYKLAKDILAGRKNIQALTLACGDMSGEYGFFKLINATQVDAYDISEGQKEKFYSYTYDGQIEVNYQIDDVNKLSLPECKYDVVYIQQSYHHLSAIEKVADEINKSLSDNGIFVICDYIGTNYLQRSAKQRKVCGKIWATMPERYRTNPQGKILDKIWIPDKKTLPPHEAMRSEEILEVLQTKFSTNDMYLYGGILFPLFNQFARNYTDSEEDQTFLKVMWELDQILIENDVVEPNFIRAVFKKQ